MLCCEWSILEWGDKTETEREAKIDSCYECSVKEHDSSQKKVYYCELCGKWFCERHLKPKFPFFIDWDTIFDVQGNREIKLRYHTEYRRKGGHPDFVYWQREVEKFEIEEKARNEMIKQAIDRMMHPEKYGVVKPAEYETDTTKRVEILLKEEIELDEIGRKGITEKNYVQSGGTTVTYDNIHHHEFRVPTEVYSVIKYRSRLNTARTLEEVEKIIKDYNKHRRKERKQELHKKKEQWWQ